jgi:[ribosomal protein S18]-alanine N-acetyltransferase
MNPKDVSIKLLLSQGDLPETLSMQSLIEFLHESLKPYEDSPEDIGRALSRALDNEEAAQGFVLLSMQEGQPTGIVVVHHTPWSGYVPENLLLYIAVAPAHRGHGLGRDLLEAAIDRCDGDIKLHVEHENPAMRLYERVGFTSKYAEMRYSK